jgi:hypothetical protein
LIVLCLVSSADAQITVNFNHEDFYDQADVQPAEDFFEQQTPAPVAINSKEKPDRQDFWKRTGEKGEYGPDRAPKVEAVPTPEPVIMKEAGQKAATVGLSSAKPIDSKQQEKLEITGERVVDRAAAVIEKLRGLTAAKKRTLLNEKSHVKVQKMVEPPPMPKKERAQREKKTNNLRDKIRGMNDKQSDL